jgi:hypothetical protein
LVAQMVNLWSSCSIANNLPNPCKISTRSYYSPDIAVEFCRRSGQGLQLPLPSSSQSDHHSEGNDGLHRRLSPTSEVDNKSTNSQTRRRIAVAVSSILTTDFSLCDDTYPARNSVSDVASARSNAVETLAMAMAVRIAAVPEKHQVAAHS